MFTAYKIILKNGININDSSLFRGVDNMPIFK